MTAITNGPLKFEHGIIAVVVVVVVAAAAVATVAVVLIHLNDNTCSKTVAYRQLQATQCCILLWVKNLRYVNITLTTQYL
jgi:uncharacterized membrane-anchored protein